VERTDLQEDFALSYGFHIPARLSLARQAAKLRTGPAADAVRFATDHGHADPLLWTARSKAALRDALTRIISGGADAATELARWWTRCGGADPGAEAELSPVHRESGLLAGRVGVSGSAVLGRLLGPQRRHLWFWIFTGPFVLGLVVFVYVPLVWSITLSFFDARNTVTPSHFVGLGNYAAVLTDPAFTASLATFAVFALFIVPATYVLALGLALLVHRARFAKGFFRSVFFLPTACSYVAASLIWKLSIFNGVRFGLANTVLRWFGADPVAWLSTTQPPWYWLVIVTVRLWLQAGFYLCCSWRACNASRARCTRRRRWTAPGRGGRPSATSPSPSCGRPRWRWCYCW